MKNGPKLKPKENKFLLILLGVLLITITTLIFWSILQKFLQIYYLNVNLFPCGLITIISTIIVSAVFAYIFFNNLPGKIRKKLVEEKYNLEQKLKQITLRFEEALEQIRHETAERQRVEKVLNESESKFREFIQNAPEGIVLLNKEGVIMECNPAFQEMLGYVHEELIGVRFFQAVHPVDVAIIKAGFKELLQGKDRFYRIEHRYIHKDFREVWGLLSSSIIVNANEEPNLIIAIVNNITERRQAEEKILNYQKQMRSLTSESSLTEEHNRRRLATNLHDHIGQVLSMVKFKINELEQSLSNDARESLLQEIAKTIDQAIIYTRYLMFEISPPILYDLGLEETIEWLAENYDKQHGIQMQVIRDQQTKPLNTKARILLFQAVRELLDNIVKHANATVVRISIQRAFNDLKVIVEDNGVGFDPRILDPQVNQTKGWGLFSIYERFKYWGGSLEIESERSKGSRVTLLIPLQNRPISWADFKENYIK